MFSLMNKAHGIGGAQPLIKILLIMILMQVMKKMEEQSTNGQRIEPQIVSFDNDNDIAK